MRELVRRGWMSADIAEQLLSGLRWRWTAKARGGRNVGKVWRVTGNGSVKEPGSAKGQAIAEGRKKLAESGVVRPWTSTRAPRLVLGDFWIPKGVEGDGEYRWLVDARPLNLPMKKWGKMSLAQLVDWKGIWGPGSRLWIGDLRKAYYSVALAEGEGRWCGVVWDGVIMEVVRMLMGVTIAVGFFSRVPRPLLNMLESKHPGVHFLAFIDDIAMMTEPGVTLVTAEKVVVELVLMIRAMGGVWAVEKEVRRLGVSGEESTECVWLGHGMDVATGEVWVEERKLEGVRRELELWKARLQEGGRLSLERMESVLGSLGFWRYVVRDVFVITRRLVVVS